MEMDALERKIHAAMAMMKDREQVLRSGQFPAAEEAGEGAGVAAKDPKDAVPSTDEAPAPSVAETHGVSSARLPTAVPRPKTTDTVPPGAGTRDAVSEPAIPPAPPARETENVPANYRGGVDVPSSEQVSQDKEQTSAAHFGTLLSGRSSDVTEDGQSRSSFLSEENVPGVRLYARAMAVQKAKKQRAAAYRDKECTFAPNTNRRSLGAWKSEEPVEQRLYKQAVKQMEQKRAAATQASSKAGAFKPAITKKAQKAGGDVTGAARLNRLYQHAASRREQLEQAKARRMTEGCTFAPSITHKAARRKSEDGRGISERLYEHTKVLEEKRQQMTQKHEEQLRQQHTFRPQMRSRRSRSAPRLRDDGSTFLERSAQKKQEVDEKIARAREEKERRERAQETFKPRIVSRIDSKRHSLHSGDVFERLHAARTEAEQKLEELRQKHEREEELRLKAQRHKRRSSSAPRRRPQEQLPIHERLHQESVSVARRVDGLRKQAEKEEIAACTFKPSINARPGTGTPRGQAGSDGGNAGPVWDRLHENLQPVKLLREEMKRQQELQGCTFKPQIPKSRSRQGTPVRERSDASETGSTSSRLTQQMDTPVFDRLSQSVDYDKLQKQRESRELEGCTFTPEIMPSPGRQQAIRDGVREELVSPRLSIFDRLKAEATERKKREEEFLRLKEERESEGCTFRPTLASRRPRTPRRASFGEGSEAKASSEPCKIRVVPGEAL